ncbi:hypothetical protein J3F84DRAFT_360052 [Trichoderma pleuroticola]
MDAVVPTASGKNGPETVRTSPRAPSHPNGPTRTNIFFRLGTLVANHQHSVLYSLIRTTHYQAFCANLFLSIPHHASQILPVRGPVMLMLYSTSRSSFASGTRPTRDQVGWIRSIGTLHTVCLCSSCIIAVCPPVRVPGLSLLRPSQIPSHGALFHLCAQPIRVPSQGVPPSQRRAAAAIVAKSPFQPSRPVLETLMRQRAASAYACRANPRQPPAPGATNYRRAFPVYPASRRPQMRAAIRVHAALHPIKRAHMAVTCARSIQVDRSVDDYVRAIGGIGGRLVSKPSYSTRALAPWYTAPVAGVYRDREMASDPRSCPLLSSKWDNNPNRRLMSTSTSHDERMGRVCGYVDRLITRACLLALPYSHFR